MSVETLLAPLSLLIRYCLPWPPPPPGLSWGSHRHTPVGRAGRQAANSSVVAPAFTHRHRICEQPGARDRLAGHARPTETALFESPGLTFDDHHPHQNPARIGDLIVTEESRKSSPGVVSLSSSSVPVGHAAMTLRSPSRMWRGWC